MLQYKNRLILAGIFVLCIIMLHLFGLQNYINLDQLKQYADQLQELVKYNYWCAVLIYMFLFIGATVAGLPVTVVLTIAAGFLFGIISGTCYAIIAATIGGILLFITVRYLIGSWVQTRYAMQLQRFNQEVAAYGPGYLLAMQILPVTPTFFINLIAGVSRISLWTFVWTTVLGIFPGTLMYTWAGQQLHLMQSIRDVMTFSFLFLFFFLSLLLLALIVWRWLYRSS